MKFKLFAFIGMLTHSISALGTQYVPAIWCDEVRDGKMHTLKQFVLHGKNFTGLEKSYERFPRLTLEPGKTSSAKIKLYFTDKPASTINTKITCNRTLQLSEPSIEIFGLENDFPKARYQNTNGEIETLYCMDVDPGPGGGGMSGGN